MSNDSRKIKLADARKSHAALKAAIVNHITFDRADILELLKQSDDAHIRVYLGTPHCFAAAVNSKEVATQTMFRSIAECPPHCENPL